jgi:hypothetical protein
VAGLLTHSPRIAFPLLAKQWRLYPIFTEITAAGTVVDFHDYSHFNRDFTCAKPSNQMRGKGIIKTENGSQFFVGRLKKNFSAQLPIFYYNWNYLVLCKFYAAQLY